MKIITDSTADLTKELYEQLDIGMVPLTIQLGERRWRDFYDVKPEAYFALLRASTDFPNNISAFSSGFYQCLYAIC